jgi:large subunit ribosomal protein L6
MSRIGRRVINLPKGVKVDIKENTVGVQGPKGKLDFEFDPRFSFELNGEELAVKRPTENKKDRALHGLYRAYTQNMVTGVTQGFNKVLVFIGIGYRAKVQGNQLNLTLGYSHPINVDIPEGISVAVDDKIMEVTVSGIDKQQVGQFAADIRQFRPVEPYKGKGIRYKGEYVLIKEGKSGGK